MWDVEGNINEIWHKVADGIKRVAKEVIGDKRGINKHSGGPKK